MKYDLLSSLYIPFQDNDDDGEALAGGKMAHLVYSKKKVFRVQLSILEVENVFVMVSRWFGGILLGPGMTPSLSFMNRSIQGYQQYDKKDSG